ncbi:MAG: MOSC N-terminal beta barrel domain-containing protein [Pseudomonadota bacterium]
MSPSTVQTDVYVDSLHIYPIKSISGLSLDRGVVTPRGLEDDRRLMLVDERFRFITGRQHPSLVLVRATRHADGWTVDAPGQPTLNVTLPDSTAPGTEVTVWRDTVPGRRICDEIDRWFSDYLGHPCHLVYQHEQDRRPVGPADGTLDDDSVSFADGYPVLLIGTASLADLNQRLPRAMSMARFRTNIVARTDVPFMEDDWTRVRIGDVVFDVVKRCARCVFTTIDPLSGVRDPGNEPLTTLTRYRRDPDGGVMFGVNLVPRSPGAISAGDAIVPIAR